MKIQDSVDVPKILEAALAMSLDLVPRDPVVLDVAKALFTSTDPKTKAALEAGALAALKKHQSELEALAANPDAPPDRDELARLTARRAAAVEANANAIKLAGSGR